jgi:hypothetical protein
VQFLKTMVKNQLVYRVFFEWIESVKRFSYFIFNHAGSFTKISVICSGVDNRQ